MTVKTSYFDGTTYAAADDVAPWLALLADGVYNLAGGSFAVSAASPNNLSVNVAAGQAIKTGYFISSDAIVNVPITANTSGFNRIDNIVLNVDTAGKATTVTVQQGTPSSSPTAPIPAANQLVLTQVYVGNNVSVINSGNITDKRTLPKVLSDSDLLDGKHATDFWANSDITQNLATTGYMKLKNGLIMQWGESSAASGTAITLPITPPTGILKAFANPYSSTIYTAQVASKLTTTFQIIHNAPAGTIIFWFALTY